MKSEQCKPDNSSGQNGGHTTRQTSPPFPPFYAVFASVKYGLMVVSVQRKLTKCGLLMRGIKAVDTSKNVFRPIEVAFGFIKQLAANSIVNGDKHVCNYRRIGSTSMC